MGLIQVSLKELTTGLRARHATEIAWVLVSQVVSLIGGLFLLKLLTNLLSTAAFGYVSLITIAIIFPTWLLFLPFSQALTRFYFAHKQRGGLRSLIGTTFQGYLSSSLCVVALGSLTAFLGLQNAAGISNLELGLAVLLLIIEAWRGLFTGIMAADRRRLALAKQSALEAVLRPGLVYALISALGTSVGAVLVAYICSSLLLLLLVQGDVRKIIPKAGKMERNSQLAREMLKYGLPMGVAAIFNWGQNYADRFVVALLLGVDVAGQYAAALQLSQFPFVAGASFLTVLISPVANQMAGDASSEKDTARGIRLIAVTTCVFAGLGSLLIPTYYAFGDLLTKTVASKDYLMSPTLIAMLAIGALLRSVGNLLGQGLLVKNRTDQFLVVFCVLGIVCPIISYLLVLKYQLYGAGIAYLCIGALYAISIGAIARAAERRPTSNYGYIEGGR